MAVAIEIVNVNGMSCNHCVNTIETALKELNGVQSIKVDLKGKKVTVSFDERVGSLETIKGTIEEAGYDVAS